MIRFVSIKDKEEVLIELTTSWKGKK